MALRSLSIDEKESKITVRTRAIGLLARLAHDLEIASSEVRGTATEDAEGWTADVVLPVASLRVLGARKGGEVDTGALSASDRADIERKLREEIFRGGHEIAVRARGALRDKGEVTLTIGGSRSARFDLTQTSTDGVDSTSTIAGRFHLSLRALKIPEVKGPLNAFRIDDTVEILYNLVVKSA